MLCRLSAVVWPLSHRSKHQRTRVMVVAAWLLASLCSLPQVQHSSDLNTLYGQQSKKQAFNISRLKINKRGIGTTLADIIYGL